MSVLAVLNVASTATAPNTTTASVTPTPTPVSMIGSPTIAVFGTTTDLANSRMQYSYLIYQTYNAAGGATGMAQTSGTSAWVSIPAVSHDFPNVSVSTTQTGAIVGGAVNFTINATVSYTETTPGLYTVTTE